MDDRVIDLSQSVHEIGTKHPEIVGMMVSLGFESLANPAMFQTAARFTTIPMGAKMHHVDLELIKEKIRELGFKIKE